MPKLLYDGDFTVAQLAGPPQYEIPFKADPRPYAYKLPFWQLLTSYTELALGTPGPIGGTHVGGTPGSFKSVGGGIIEFFREYALVPNLRSEFESYTYAYQFARWGAGGTGLTEVPITVQCRMQYDYFQTDDPEGEIVLPKAPKALQIFESLHFIHGWGSLYPGQEILAQDATMKCWKGNIYERFQRFIVILDPGSAI